MVEIIGVLCKTIILMNLGKIGNNLIKFGVEMIWRSNRFAAKIVFGTERWVFERPEMGVQTLRSRV